MKCVVFILQIKISDHMKCVVFILQIKTCDKQKNVKSYFLPRWPVMASHGQLSNVIVYST
jgi:membrane protein CcdC involved in cytochrome C biogenesis